MKKYLAIALAALMTVACATKKQAPQPKHGLDPAKFAAEYQGQPTALYTLTNASGMEVAITNFGGRIVSIMVPDKDGVYTDVVLGFDNVQSYFPENGDSNYGAALGRYANRIDGGIFSIDDKEYELPHNDGTNCLHGGFTGWHNKVYEVMEADASHLKRKMGSPDGDMQFPGHVVAYVTYTLTDANAIDIKYEATTDAPTVINMSNHSYFNLGGDPQNHSVCDELMYINASGYTPINATSIPFGTIDPVAGTPFDFTTPKIIGKDIAADNEQLKNGSGIDHNYVLDTKGDESALACRLTNPANGITLDIYTNEPGLQVYTGNFLDGSAVGKGGKKFAYRGAICLETQHYPDSPNKPQWPSTVLRPGEKYYSHCVFAFSVTK